MTVELSSKVKTIICYNFRPDINLLSGFNYASIIAIGHKLKFSLSNSIFGREFPLSFDKNDSTGILIELKLSQLFTTQFA